MGSWKVITVDIDDPAKRTRQVEIEGEMAYCCPGCSERPDRMAVYAGTYSMCENDDCLVDTWRWWEND